LPLLAMGERRRKIYRGVAWLSIGSHNRSSSSDSASLSKRELEGDSKEGTQDWTTSMPSIWYGKMCVSMGARKLTRAEDFLFCW